MKNILVSCAFLFLCSCNQTEEEDSAAFFTSPRFNGRFSSTLQLLYPDSVVKRIYDVVPPKWQGLACESAYYNLKEGTPDSIIFKHFDLYDKWFPHDTVFAFTQALRGKHFMRQNRYDTALVCLNKAWDLSVKINSVKRMINVKESIAEYHSRQGNYPEAIKVMLEAHNMFNLLPNKEPHIFETEVSIGNAYKSGNDYASAQIWHLQALNFARSYDPFQYYKIRAATLVADNYRLLNKLDSAKLMIDSAFYYQNIYQRYYDEANQHYILAEILLAQGECSDALTHFWDARQKNLKTTDLIKVNKYLEGLGDGYLCLQKQDSAIGFYQQALATPDTIRKVAVHRQLAKAYSQQGQHDRSFQHEQESRMLSEKIFTSEKEKTIGRLQAKYELAKREWEISSKENELQMMRLVMVNVFLLLSMLIVVALNRFRRQKQVWQIAEKEKLILAKEKELVEAREQLKSKALHVVKSKIDALEQSIKTYNKELHLKESLIQELKTKLNMDTDEIETS
jgi:tetratricopeptide (TPR) repeat protein